MCIEGSGERDPVAGRGKSFGAEVTGEGRAVQWMRRAIRSGRSASAGAAKIETQVICRAALRSDHGAADEVLDDALRFGEHPIRRRSRRSTVAPKPGNRNRRGEIHG